MIAKLYKGVFADYNPRISDWDEPAVRFNALGDKIVGRPTRGFGNGGTFSYAGKDYSPEPFTNEPRMESLRIKVNDFLYKEFEWEKPVSFALCGRYPDSKGIPHHSDTVPTLDDLVVSISFGAPRVFEWIEYAEDVKTHSNTSELIDKSYLTEIDRKMYIVEDGDVFIFDGASQMRSTHAVPTVHGVEERINITFRTGI